MKPFLRWLAVVPGAIAAMVAVNILNTYAIAWWAPDSLNESIKAWFGSMGLVVAAYYIAPKGKFITSVVVATAYCAIGTFAALLSIKGGESKNPAWLVMVTTALSLGASAVACMVTFSMEKETQSSATVPR